MAVLYVWLPVLWEGLETVLEMRFPSFDSTPVVARAYTKPSGENTRGFRVLDLYVLN